MNQNKFNSTSKLVKNTLFNLAGMLLPLVVGLVTIPFVIKGLGNELFGVLSIAWAIIASLTLLDFGIGRATTKYASENLRVEKGRLIPQILWTAIVLNCLFGIVGAIIFYQLISIIANDLLNISGQFITDAILTFEYIAFLIPFLLLTNSLKGILSAAQRFDLINYVTMPVNSLSFIFPVFSLLGFSLPNIIMAIVIIRIFATIVYYFMCISIFPACKVFQRPQFDLIKTLSSFGIWVTISGVINPLLVYVDRFFIGAILSMGALTFYAAPMEAIQRLRILPMALMNTLFPEFSTGLSHSEIQKQHLLFSKSFKLILIFSGLVCITLFAFSEELILIWLGIEFVEKSAAILKIISISILFNFLALVPYTFLQGTGRPDLTAKFHVFESIFYFILLSFLIRQFGLVGAAYAWSIRVIVDFLLLIFWSGKFLTNLYQSLLSEKIWYITFSLLIYGAIQLSIKNIFPDLLALQIGVSILSLFLLVWFYWKYILDNTEQNLAKGILFRRSLKKAT